MSTDLKTPRERIENLLRIHGGHCFIVEAAEDFDAMAAEARKMQGAGHVTVTPGAGHVTGLDVRKKGYRPKRATAGEMEPQTH